jgi:hypothetical protein
VLVLNSIRLKSSAVGFAGDLANIDNKVPASKPKNELTLLRMDIKLVALNHYSHWAVAFYPVYRLSLYGQL